MEKRLYRSKENKLIAGVCGGIGEYFDIDPVFVRILTVLLTFADGLGLIAYIVAWIIIPKREYEPAEAENGPAPAPELQQSSEWHKYLPGLILILIGAVLLVREHWYWFNWGDFWPVLLVAAGLVLIFKRSSRKEAQKAASEQTDKAMSNGEPKPENGGSAS